MTRTERRKNKRRKNKFFFSPYLTEEQSVSKWESGASIPDLDKIIKMSDLFGVSTDYLLKDELEEVTFSETDHIEEAVRSISIEEANAFMNDSKVFAKWLAPAVAAIILGVVPIVLLGGLSEYGNIGLTENMAGGFGVAILLSVVAIAVGIIIVRGLQYGKYEYLEKETITLQYGVQGVVQKKKESYEPTFRTCIAVGVVMIILGLVPMMVAAAFSASEMVVVYLACLFLILVAGAVFLFIRSSVVYGSFGKLLQQGDYTVENKDFNRKIEFFPGVYWCSVTAIFLACGFITENWGTCGLIWPVAGVIFAAIIGIMKSALGGNKKRDNF